MSLSSTARPAAHQVGQFGCRQHDLDGGVVRVALYGALDSAAAVDTLDQILRSVHAAGVVAVIDLDELTSIDAASARMLRAAASRARLQGRRLVALNAQPHVERALKLMGIPEGLKLVNPQPLVAVPAAQTPDPLSA